LSGFKPEFHDTDILGKIVARMSVSWNSGLNPLNVASLRGRWIEYQLWVGVRAGMSPLPVGT